MVFFKIHILGNPWMKDEEIQKALHNIKKNGWLKPKSTFLNVDVWYESDIWTWSSSRELKICLFWAFKFIKLKN